MMLFEDGRVTLLTKLALDAARSLETMKRAERMCSPVRFFALAAPRMLSEHLQMQHVRLGIVGQHIDGAVLPAERLGFADAERSADHDVNHPVEFLSPIARPNIEVRFSHPFERRLQELLVILSVEERA